MPAEISKIIVEAVVSISVILITTYVIPWIKSKIGEDKYALIQTYTELAVRSAEQLYSEEEWKDKKKYVLNCVDEKLREIGLELSEIEINNIIEGIVNAVKKA